MQNNTYLFEQKLSAVWRKIGNHAVMTFSTCADNRVSSRPMSVVVIDGKFYCQTDETYLKWQQLQQNSNCALCIKNICIEGKCRNIGKPLDIDNQFFVKEFKKHFLPSYIAYSARPREILLEISPTLIYLWEYKLAKPFMEYFDFENFIYRKEDK